MNKITSKLRANYELYWRKFVSLFVVILLLQPGREPATFGMGV